jgi:hypothetical protein
MKALVGLEERVKLLWNQPISQIVGKTGFSGHEFVTQVWGLGEIL